MSSKIDSTIDSRLLASIRLVRLRGETILDMNGDPRLERLVQRVNEEITRNHWDTKHNEKEICTAIVRLEHSQEFYGNYNREIAGKSQKMEASLRKLIDNVREGKFDARDTSNANNFLSAIDKNKHVKLSECPANSLVCEQEAAVASYVMQKVGIENDYCSAPGLNGLGHAFVQTKASAKIVDATDDKKPYRQNLSGGRIRNGDVVITRADNDVIYAYGNGKTRMNINAEHSEDMQKLITGYNTEDYKHSVAVAMGAYEKNVLSHKQPNFDPSKPITVEQAQDNYAHHIAVMDRGKHVLGVIPAGGRLDGNLAREEITGEIMRLKPSFEDRTPQGLAKLPAAEPAYDMVRGVELGIRRIDKNHDGIITPKEIEDKVKDEINYSKNHGKAMSPTEVNKYREFLTTHIYSRD